MTATQRGEESTRILWLGDTWQPGKRLLLYFHGGGYVLPMLYGYLDFLAHVKAQAENTALRDSLCVAVVEYGIPHPLPHLD